MKLSQLFTRTLREAPSDETAANARLLTRGGFVHKVMAGVYVYLPLGVRVLEKINRIIREEMNATGAQELHMSVLQNRATWDATGRWDGAKDVMYQFTDAAGHATGLGWTHEEPLTELARHHISSYKDLPKAVYQIQVKFRNEPRAKSGILRGREFLMKDLYSFHADEESLNGYYEQVAQAYLKIFSRIGLPALRTTASGGLFSKFSDEFQVLADVGEDTIHHTEDHSFVCNADVYESLKESGGLPDGELRQSRAIEVGNIFKLGTRFSEALGLTFTDRDGASRPVIMASYGIGPGRAMGTVVELNHDERGIIWPASVAPFGVHLVDLARDGRAERLYDELTESGTDVLWDDREDASAGEKFADADLIGCPVRLTVGKKTEEGKVEFQPRSGGDAEVIATADAVQRLSR
ncbi:MAG TPA: aminoacyl--tRNA ligase-related protein [Candidatus Paceibacterota bacterium]|nr:aminoacyl--tRNA ligase-related protein [Candidatus Paceibacterota bacterium]